MKFLLISVICLVLWNCEDTKSNIKQKKSQPIIKINKQETVIADSSITIKRKYPLLNDSNAMDFFLDYEKHNPENKVRITTNFGNIDILLFTETKFHRANFIFLTKQHYFDNTQFYRVINNFVIQGGNTDDPKVKRKRKTIGKYLLPKDNRHGFRHNRGAVSMPSSDINNPYKLASPFQFFIVQQKGGAQHLNGNYTVFGKVVKGMDVVDTIAKQETDNADWPLSNIYIKKIEIIN